MYVLGFFPRIETRSSAFLVLNLGMLGLACGRWPAWEEVRLSALCLALGLLHSMCVSLHYAGDAVVPDGGDGTDTPACSGSIAAMQENEFHTQFMNPSDQRLECDLLDHAWRNTRILSKRFNALRNANW